MKRSRLLNILLVFVLFLVSYLSSSEGSAYLQPPAAEGKYVLLRLEDVGPGGFYGTPEGLGKLRAVIEYLTEQNIPYHITVVSRWKHYDEKKGWEEAGIDTPTPLTQSFVSIIRYAQEHGAILGMHGYSHQYGDVPRDDGQENSGFAYEFNIKGESNSRSDEYAAQRIEKSLNAFEKNGLQPDFWESPHYHSTFNQQEVFRSYMGLIYEPNWYTLRSLKDVVYVEDDNHWKAASTGSVYIPAPLKYVNSEDRVPQILDQLKNYNGLASMYFHPFMEFNYLEPAMVNGQQELRDGLPVFQYKKGDLSPLHKLISGIKQLPYTFGTIHDIVPFTPANRVQLSEHLSPNHLLVGDLNLDGRDDWIGIDTSNGKAFVTLSNVHWPRNTQYLEPKVWLQDENLKGNNSFLLVSNGETKRSDLLAITNSSMFLYKNEGDHFNPQAETITLPQTMQKSNSGKLVQNFQWISDHTKRSPDSIVAIDKVNNKGLILKLNRNSLEQRGEFDLPPVSTSDKIQYFAANINGNTEGDLVVLDSSTRKTWVLTRNGDSFQNPVLWSLTTYEDQAGTGDTNGDGRTDMIFYNNMAGLWQVVRPDGGKLVEIPARFGPWGRSRNGTVLSGDWDGNGKTDIAVYNPSTGAIDTALSFQR